MLLENQNSLAENYNYEKIEERLHSKFDKIFDFLNSSGQEEVNIFSKLVD